MKYRCPQGTNININNSKNNLLFITFKGMHEIGGQVKIENHLKRTADQSGVHFSMYLLLSSDASIDPIKHMAPG